MKNLRAIVVLVLIAAAVLYAQTNTKTGRNYTGNVSGVTQGDITYPVDPGYFSVRDDFALGNTTSGTIGDLGWTAVGTLTAMSGATAGQTSPGFFHPGGMSWATSTTSPGTPKGLTFPNFNASGQWAGAAWPLLDEPSSELVWIFSLRRDGVSTTSVVAPTFAKKSLYVGLVNLLSNIPGPGRPANFIGVRYDTSATAPAISDTTFWLEAVENGNSASRQNAQGGITCTITNFALTTNVETVTCANSLTVGEPVTFSNVGTNTFLNGVTVNVVSSSSTQFTANFIHGNVVSAAETGTVTASGGAQNTSITPAENVNYRLSVKFTAAGKAVVTLSGGGSTSTATFTMLQNTVTNLAVSNIVAANGFASLSTAAPIPPWAPGSQITVTNITAGGATGMNGTYTLDSNNQSAIFYPNSTTFGSSAQNYTAAAYPTYSPFISFCNDDTATPVSHGIIVDFFGFVWNPGGTVDATQSRYFAGT